MLSKNKYKVSGSTTVEAAMIFPLIMFIMFGLIFLTIVHFQKNVMIAESLRAMNRAGAYYQYIDMDKYGKFIEYDEKNIPTAFDSKIPKDGIINTAMLDNRNPYRTVLELIDLVVSKINGGSFGKKRLNAKNYVKSRMANVKFKMYTTDEDTIISDVNDKTEKDNTGLVIFGNDLSITIRKKYNIMPILGLTRAILGKNSVVEKLMNNKLVVNSVISNQPEFIRNVDAIYDLASDTYSFIKSEK